jgi:oligoendopeptidase F
MTKTDEIKWNLGIIFENNDQVKEFMKTCEIDAENLQNKHMGKINSDDITSKELLEFIEQLNTTSANIDEVYYFAKNQLAADQTVKESLILNNTASNLFTKGSMILTSFQLELGQLCSRRQELLKDPLLKHYKHYLEKLVDKTKYMLSANEERIILEKDRYGKKSWSKLQNEWLSSREFKIIDEGKEKTVTWGDYDKYTRSPSRETRKSAIVNIVGEKGLAKDKEIYAASLRSICGDHGLTCKRRKHPTTYTSSVLTNDITQKMLDNLLEVVNENIDLYKEFLLLKAKIMGTEKLLGEDLWVPIPLKGIEEYQKFSWRDAIDIITKVFTVFDTEFGTITQKMLTENHVDASPRKGKQAGAYCSLMYIAKEAFILMSFNETFYDVSTLAHEMGHAVHAYLAVEENKFLNNEVSFCIAETASEFGRFLFVDYFMEQDNDLLKKFILFNHLEDLATVIYEVGSRTVFEKSLYDTLEAGKYLDAETISDLFVKARKQFFGDAIEFLPEQQYDWIWKPHYYRTDLRYYNYPYYFGELLVMAFYNVYKKEGKSFIPKFKNFLATGGSKSALELGKSMEVDLEDKAFWQMGIDEFKRILNETKALFE